MSCCSFKKTKSSQSPHFPGRSIATVTIRHLKEFSNGKRILKKCIPGNQKHGNHKHSFLCLLFAAQQESRGNCRQTRVDQASGICRGRRRTRPVATEFRHCPDSWQRKPAVALQVAAQHTDFSTSNDEKSGSII